MEVTQTYKFKMYRNRRNDVLNQRIDIAGIVWNHCVALHKTYYRLTGKFLKANQLMKHITKLKKLPRYAFWNEVGSQAIQDIVQRVDRAYNLFFSTIEKKRKASPPKFRKVKKYRSITYKQAGYKFLDGNKVKIQGKVYKYSKSREIEGTIKTVTIKRDAMGNMWLIVVTKRELEITITTGKSAVGFDFGLKTFLTGSDGSRHEASLFLKQSLNKLAKAQRALSRKVRYSKNWYKAKKNVARIHQRVVDQRRDYFFKLAQDLTDVHDYIFLEDLNMRGMAKLWGRKIHDLALSEFVGILAWVATKKGKHVGYVDRFFASSKLCHCCGHKNKDLELYERRWVCPGCGVIHDRDFNASVNICTEAGALWARCCGVGNVRPSSLAQQATAIPV